MAGEDAISAAFHEDARGNDWRRALGGHRGRDKLRMMGRRPIMCVGAAVLGRARNASLRDGLREEMLAARPALGGSRTTVEGSILHPGRVKAG
jgi:hypothetical protein